MLGLFSMHLLPLDSTDDKAAEAKIGMLLADDAGIAVVGGTLAPNAAAAFGSYCSSW